MHNRSNYGGLDRFRILAALLVAAIHTSPLASISEGADFFLTRILGRIAVPFFFMVTGQFIAAGLLKPSVKKIARYHKFLQKTVFLYLGCILLYLPVGIYAGHYQDIGISSALRLVLFDGPFYHLWYFPACITGILLVRLMSRFLHLRAMTALSACLYIIGLMGDSYFGLTVRVPFLNAVYEFLFGIFSYTRNGLFLAPVFLVLGMWMVPDEREIPEEGDSPVVQRRFSLSPLTIWVGFLLSFAAMTAEAFILRRFELQRHDSMYIALVPAMFFLYRGLMSLQAQSSAFLRNTAMWIYILHPAAIVAVRGIARPLRLTELLVENNLSHYLAVAALSCGMSLFLACVQKRLGPVRLLSRRRKKASAKIAPGQELLSPEDSQWEQEWQENQPSEDSQWEQEWQENDYPEEIYNEQSMEEQIPVPEETRILEKIPAALLPNASALKEEDPFARKDFPKEQADSQTQISHEVSNMQINMESESDFTQEKTDACSRAWIELDIAALEQNVQYLRSRLPGRCRLMPAVKAEAYGHGGVFVSQQLNRLGVDAFCVACAAEGITLRQAGIRGEILILGYTAPEDFPLLERYQLTQTVIDYPYALELNRYGRRLHVHIGIDTGMHRVGIRCEDIEDIAAVYKMKNLAVDGIFTHLCASDSPHPDHRRFTQSQIRAFYDVIDILREQGRSCRGMHILASYGILNLLQDKTKPGGSPAPEENRCDSDIARLAGDYVRPGIVLFGVLSTQTDFNVWKDVLRPVLSLKTRIASVRPLHAGESVGYGITYTARQDMRIATLCIGYGDGLPRALSNGNGSVLINGSPAPVIGRICMDQTIVDITGIPDVQSGDTAVIIGVSGDREITAGQVAEQCGTISHEILTGLAPRLERIVINHS